MFKEIDFVQTNAIKILNLCLKCLSCCKKKLVISYFVLYQEILLFKVKKKLFLKYDGLIFGTPLGTVFHTIFSGKDILHKKTSAIKYTKK